MFSRQFVAVFQPTMVQQGGNFPQVNYTAEWCLNGTCREHFLPRSQGSHGAVHISKPPQAGEHLGV